MKTKPQPLSAKNRFRLSRYTVLAGAGLASTGSADASIVLWDSSNWNLTPGENATITAQNPGDYLTIFFDFENGQVSNGYFDSTFYLAAGVGTNYRSAAVMPNGSASGGMLQSNNFPALLASGAAVGASQAFGSVAILADDGGLGNWRGGTHQGYVGLKFKIDPNSTKVYYGWADITVDFPNSGPVSITLDRFAYNDVDGGKILAGQTTVPEPDTALPMALLVLGSAGMGRYRRRNRASKK